MSRRRGAILLEVTMAVVLLATALIAVAQLAAVAVQQQRETERRTLATRVAANVLERVASQPYDRLGNTDAPPWELPPDVADRLPAARLEVEVKDVDQPLGGKQIRVAIDWTNAAGQRVQPLSLVTWRYRREGGE